MSSSRARGGPWGLPERKVPRSSPDQVVSRMPELPGAVFGALKIAPGAPRGTPRELQEGTSVEINGKQAPRWPEENTSKMTQDSPKSGPGSQNP